MMKNGFSGLPFVLYMKIGTMKKVIFTAVILIATYAGFAQLKSSNVIVPASAQPVPNATATEKSAPPQPQIIAPAPNPVPPIYPGAEVKAAEVQRQIINPPSTPTGTQPVQKEPLSPIESTNNLQPTRPQRDEKSRDNPVIEISRPANNIQPTTNKKVRVINNNNRNIYKNNTTTTTNVKIKSSNTSNKVDTKAVSKKISAAKKKPSKS